jgi:hypothetical protein
VKRLLASLVLVLFFTGVSFAAGTFSCTPSPVSVSGSKQRVVLTCTWIADSSHAFSDQTITPADYGIDGWYLISSETLALTPAPTDAYVVAIKTDWGATLFTMTGSNSTSVGVLTNYQKVTPVYFPLTFSVSGNSVNSATGKARLVFTSN